MSERVVKGGGATNRSICKGYDWENNDHRGKERLKKQCVLSVMDTLIEELDME